MKNNVSDIEYNFAHVVNVSIQLQAKSHNKVDVNTEKHFYRYNLTLYE